MKHLPNIVINIREKDKMRYDTLGDWYKECNHWRIEVAKSDFLCELLVIIHELWEMAMCILHNIKEKDVTKFDIQSGLDEPGDNIHAPYHFEHNQAIKLEKFACKLSGENWEAYNNILKQL